MCVLFKIYNILSDIILASMSGVSYGSIKRFETTGQISLVSLTKIAMALDIADELRNIFTQVPYRNIQEVINESRQNITRTLR